jgi:hypothetical protein
MEFMSIHITGSNSQVINRLQSRLDIFFVSSKTYENAQKKLVELAAQNVELTDIPAHEDHYYTLLSEYKEAAETLKAAAEKVQKKTDQRHIHKYFRPRYSNFTRAPNSKYRYIDLQYKEPLEAIHQVVNRIIETNYESQITQAQNDSQRRKKEAQAAIEYSLLDQTFPSCCDRLIKENPDEYLRQAALYQYKLLEKKDETAVLAFGKSWIKNLPKEATWEQVESMSLIMLEAAKKSEDTDLIEYRVAVEQWLKEHPLSENPDSVPVTPAQATSPWGRRTYVLGLLYLYNPKLDLSPEAFQLYQSCSSLYPDQHSWKVAQALYHISTLQWLEAEQLLADLPKDDASVRKAQRYLSDNRRERICSAGLDLGAIAFFRLIPSSYRETLSFDIAQTSLQLISSGPARRIWFPRLLRTSERSIPRHLLVGSSAAIVGDVVDFIFRNTASLRHLQKFENFVSYGFRTTNIAWTLYPNPQQRSLPSLMNLGSLLISVSQSYDTYREIRRPAAHQAFLSTIQLMTSDLSTAITIASYSDLLPLIGIRPQQIASQIGVTRFNAQSVSRSSQATQESSRDKWLLAAIAIGSLATYRFYCDYPYLWAVSVMKEAELYYFQGKYDDANRVLTEAENSYFVSRAKPAVRNYAAYVNWLKDYPKFLEDPAKYAEFLKHLDLVLKILKGSSHYKSIRNNLLLKKIETAIRQQDPERLNEVLKEGPADKIVIFGFHFLLNCTFYLALKDPAAACSLLRKMGPSFPPRFHPITDSLLELLQAQSNSLQDWSQLNLLTVLQNPPSSEKAKQWNDALQKLQSFFFQNVGKIGVYSDFQYYKLIISFAQTNNTEQTQALFKESDAQLHQRFSHELFLYTRLLWKAKRHKEAIILLKRVQFNSFKDNELIQSYGYFFSLLYASPLQELSALKQMKALESCIAGLDIKHDYHQEFHMFFWACKIILNFDAGEYANAKNLLAQEKTDSKVPAEVAALLFERMYVSMQENGREKSLSDLKRIIENLGSWQYLELFKAFQAYLLCEPSLQVQLEHLTSSITQIVPIEQLSDFAFNLQLRRDLLQFELCLSQKKYKEAKKLLTVSMPKEFYSELCKIFFIFFIHHGEQLRQTVPLRKVRETLLRLNSFFAISNSDMIQSYVNFLAHLEDIEEKREITVHEKAYQLLNIIFKQLASIHCPIPASLKGEIVNILLKIAVLAKEAGQLKTALAALESIKQLGIPVEHLDEFIIHLKEQLNA